MGRIFQSNSSGQPIAASTTTTFNSTQIPSTGLVALHFTATGANNTLSNVSRIRVKAGGTIYDILPTHYRAMVQAMTGGRIRIPTSTVLDQLGSAGTAAAIRRWTIFFNDQRQPTEELQDLCQFPRGANITVEHQFNGSASTGSLFCGWTLSSMAPMYYPKIIGNQLSVPASTAVQRFNISDEGEIIALGLNTVGLDRARLVLAGSEVLQLLGQNAASSTFLGDSMFIEAGQFDNATTDMQAATAGVPTTLLDPYVIRIRAGLPAPQGNSYVELGTNANWAGVANEVSTMSLVPQ